MTADQNVARVVAKLKHRSVVGLKKYGVPTDRAGLSRQDWLRHLQEELLDAAVYVEQLLREDPAEAIHAAQAEEQERCAKLCDEMYELRANVDERAAYLYLAKAIRGQGD